MVIGTHFALYIKKKSKPKNHQTEGDEMARRLSQNGITKRESLNILQNCSVDVTNIFKGNEDISKVKNKIFDILSGGKGRLEIREGLISLYFSDAAKKDEFYSFLREHEPETALFIRS